VSGLLLTYMETSLNRFHAPPWARTNILFLIRETARLTAL
jgi:hypothetical protein